MRRQRLLGTSPAHFICGFCAHRLAGSAVSSARPSRRNISATAARWQSDGLNEAAHGSPSAQYDSGSSPSLPPSQRQHASPAQSRSREEAPLEALQRIRARNAALAQNATRHAAAPHSKEPARETQQQAMINPTMRQGRTGSDTNGQSTSALQYDPNSTLSLSDLRARAELARRREAEARQAAALEQQRQSQARDARPDRRRMQSRVAAPSSRLRSIKPGEAKTGALPHRPQPFQRASPQITPDSRTGAQQSPPAAQRASMPTFGAVDTSAFKPRTQGWGMGSAIAPLSRGEPIPIAPSVDETTTGDASKDSVQPVSDQESADPIPQTDASLGPRPSDAGLGLPQQPRDTLFRWSPVDSSPRTDSGERVDALAALDTQRQWQNLRRRPTTPTTETRQQDRGGQSEQESGSWIDATFEKYRAQRSENARVSETFSAEDRSYERQPRPQSRTCFRCGEPGHIAVDCPRSDLRRFGATDRRTRQDRDEPAWPTTHQPTRARSEPEAQATSEPAPSFTDPAPEQDERAAALLERRMRKYADVEGDDPEHSQGRKVFNDDRKRGKASRRPRDEEEDDDELDEEEFEALQARRARRAQRKAERELKNAAKAEQRAADAAARKKDGIPITLPEFVTVATLAQLLNVRYEEFVAQLERLGHDDVFPGKALNSDTSGLIAMEFGFDPSSSADEQTDRDLYAQPELADKSLLPTRPSVVTIMGHVDHGKTTILDYLRKSSVAAGEAGGITQHIGAFSVPLAASGKTITFLDTPGHAAFLAMRQRGANVTDIVILVVAADDSVKPQTLEAIKHAQAAQVPIIVAVNKIDKAEADIQHVKQDLARHGVQIEDFGGDTQVVAVSGKTGQGMDELEESVVTLSEILDHRAETDAVAEGWVLEASTKKSGRVATVLVRRGTLRVGSVLVAGKTWARVRTLHNEAGLPLDAVGPGMPAEIDGWRDQPMAGDEVLEAPSEQKAHEVVEFRLDQADRAQIAIDMEAINEARKARQDEQKNQERDGEDGVATRAPAQPSGRIEVPFVIKADVSGSAEAVTAYVQTLSNPLISPLILESEVGPLNESDIERADAARGHIISFNVSNDDGLKNAAEARGIKVLENNIIYRVLEDVKSLLESKLPPIISQRVLGEASVGASFDIGIGGRKTLKIAGCKVRNGVIERGRRVRVMRGDEKVYDGTISSLKNVKKDVQEMRKGSECGMSFAGWYDFEIGDSIQTYEEISEKRRL